MTKRRKTSRAAKLGFYGLSLLTVVNGCRTSGHDYPAHSTLPLADQTFVSTELAESASRAADEGKNLDGTPIQGHRIQIRPYDDSPPAPAAAPDLESAGTVDRKSKRTTTQDDALVGKGFEADPPSFIRPEPMPEVSRTPEPTPDAATSFTPRVIPDRPIPARISPPAPQPEPVPPKDVGDTSAVANPFADPLPRKPVFDLTEEPEAKGAAPMRKPEREVPQPTNPFELKDPLESGDTVKSTKELVANRKPIDLEAPIEEPVKRDTIGDDDPMTLEKFLQQDRPSRPDPPAQPEAPIVLDAEPVDVSGDTSENLVPDSQTDKAAQPRQETDRQETDIVDDFQPVEKPRAEGDIPRVSVIPNLPRPPIDLTPEPGELDLAPTSDLPEVQFNLKAPEVNPGPKQPLALPSSPKFESKPSVDVKPAKPEVPMPAIDRGSEVVPRQPVTQPPSDLKRRKPTIPTPQVRKQEQPRDLETKRRSTASTAKQNGMLRLALRGLVSTGQSVQRYYQQWTDARRQTLAGADQQSDWVAAGDGNIHEHTPLEPTFAEADESQAEGVVLHTVARLQDYPFGLLVDRSGNIFVSHNKGVSRFDADGGSTMWSPIRAPRGSAMLADGSLIIADRSKRQLGRFSSDGEFLGDVISPDNANRSQVRTPNHVALDNSGGVYFTDPGFIRTRNAIGKIHYVDSTRRLTTLVTELAFPEGIKFDPVTQRLFVAESQRGRVVTFNVKSPGDLGAKQVFAKVGGDAKNSVDGLSLNSKGELFVACQEARKVLWFGVDGVLKAEIPLGDLIVSDVKVSPVDDNVIYIAGGYTFERGSGRIMRVRLSELAKMDRHARLDVP